MMNLDEEMEKKFEMMTRRLQEVLGGDLIKRILADGKAPKGYWGKHWQADFERSQQILTAEQVLQPPDDVSYVDRHPGFEI